jgi:hypothetical protein
MRGGTPSTTQPIARPWLSPNVVTRNRWPNVLWDMCVEPAAGLVARASEVVKFPPCGVADLHQDERTFSLT